jgi:hypothetical protein
MSRGRSGRIREQILSTDEEEEESQSCSLLALALALATARRTDGRSVTSQTGGEANEAYREGPLPLYLLAGWLDGWMAGWLAACSLSLARDRSHYYSALDLAAADGLLPRGWVAQGGGCADAGGGGGRRQKEAWACKQRCEMLLLLLLLGSNQGWPGLAWPLILTLALCLW